MCFVGKATKIFIFLITVVVITGLVFGFGILRHTIHPKSHKCSDQSCSQSHFYPPPPMPEFPIPSSPDPNAINSPPPPPPSSGSTTDFSPPPAATSPSVVIKPPTPSPPRPPVVTVAQPPTINPPSPVPVTPGPMNSLLFDPVV